MGAAGRLVCLILFLYRPWSQISSEACSSLSCGGWSAECNQGNCTCPAGFVLQSDGNNCKNASCSQSECLQCDQPDQCLKCLAFKSKSSGVCMSVCVGSAEQQGDNLVCTEAADDGTKVSVIIAVFAGAGAGVFICVVVLVAVCVYLRRTRRNVNLQNKNYTVRQMESGHVKQYSMYDNSGFDPESPAISSTGKIDPLDYVSQLERLRVHIDTLMTLLSQLRTKSKAMDSSDARAPTYV
ncbi:hypothetical protein Btru_004803 [Bulinus truncatus]|nr:hypothetical protein Btru_004803 [Bulinus truncatus]